MNYKTFVRRPFTVVAVEITEENIADIAKHIGELKMKDDETYIQLDRRVVPNVSKAQIGWFITRMDGNYRAYAPKVFEEQFTEWEKEITFEFPQIEEDDVEVLGDPADQPVEDLDYTEGGPIAHRPVNVSNVFDNAVTSPEDEVESRQLDHEESEVHNVFDSSPVPAAVPTDTEPRPMTPLDTPHGFDVT